MDARRFKLRRGQQLVLIEIASNVYADAQPLSVQLSDQTAITVGPRSRFVLGIRAFTLRLKPNALEFLGFVVIP